MVTRPQLDVDLGGWELWGLRIGVTLVLAELSYRYVELPIRRGELGRGWRQLREARGFRSWDLGVRWAGAVVPALAVCAVLGVAVAQAREPEAPSYLSTKRVHLEAPGSAAEQRGIAARDAAETAASAAPETNKAARVPAGQSGGENPSRGGGSAGAPTVTAVGDSAMLGAVDALRREMPNLAVIDARGSRQVTEAIAVLRQLRASGQLGEVVIVHIGNNGVFADGQFDEMMRATGDGRMVLVVNVTVPDSYSWAPNNEVLAAGVGRYPDRATLVDWQGISAGHPEYFWDGIHLTPRGARAYANAISAAYEGYGR